MAASFKILGLSLCLLLAPLSGCSTSGVALRRVTGKDPDDGVPGVSMVDEKPVVLSGSAPRYPAEMLKHGIKGEALMSFVVTKEGEVRDIRVLKATDTSFAVVASEAVQQWRYRPATHNGQPVECRVHAPLRFVIAKK
jgi:TonB family protein